MSGLARNSDPETSRIAADKLNATLLEAVVLDVLRKHGPMTSEGVADVLNMNLVSISPRFRPLANKGAIVDTGLRAKNKSGRSAILWSAAAAANRETGE